MPPANVLEEHIRRFEKTMQEGIGFAALSRVESIDVSGEMILYQATVFAKSRAIRQLRK
jgi:hypothetical protein